MKHSIIMILIAGLIFTKCNTGEKNQENEPESKLSSGWEWTPFVKIDTAGPVLEPSSEQVFLCPLQGKTVQWEEKDVFNPAGLVRNNKVHLLYRAEDAIGKYAGTSRIGLAISEDGIHFKKTGKPVFYPEEDPMKKYEWEGGCEDPRIVETDEGLYLLTYTAWDGETARLSIASSGNLTDWTKHGLAFDNYKNGKYRDFWSKSGSIITAKEGNRLIAKKIKGKYWMYWGDTDIFLASSEDLFDWNPVEDENGALKTVFGPRKGYFDSDLVEPGPPAILVDDGIWMIYNSRNDEHNGDPALPPGTYAAGQVLLDKDNPGEVIARSEKNFFKPEFDYEITGQIGNVCFLEALVPFNGQWFLYYGTADSKIAAAVYKE